MGRVDVSDAAAVFSYPGVSVKVRFKGDAIALLLKDRSAGDKRTTKYYQATLDARLPMKFAVHRDQAVYEIGWSLAPGEHTLEVVKLTESEVGTSELQGFKVHGALLDPPARPALKLEFIGDSITCGYGNGVSIPEADNPTTGFHSINQNITRSHGWLTARNLGAELVTVCYLVKDFNARGDARVHYLAYTPQQGPYGEDWHPSAATQEAMATRLTDFIRSLK